MDDEEIVNFNARRRAGEVFFNNMKVQTDICGIPTGYGVDYEAKATTCSGQAGAHKYRFRRDGPVIGNYALTWYNSRYHGGITVDHKIDTNFASLVREVATNVIARRGSNPGSNLWETLGESHKTANLLSDLLENARKVLNNTPIKRVQGVASIYLAARYGIRPLMQDLATVVSALEKKTGKVRRTTRAERHIEAYDTTSWDFTSGIVKMTFQAQRNTVSTCRVMCLDEFVATFSSNAGFTLRGLERLPIELTPLSFVLEWFVNIGDYLMTLVPALGLNQLGGCTVLEHRTSLNLQVINTVLTDANYNLVRPVNGTTNVVSITKTRLPSIAAPALVINQDFGFDRLTRNLDALALVIQRLQTGSHYRYR